MSECECVRGGVREGCQWRDSYTMWVSTAGFIYRVSYNGGYSNPSRLTLQWICQGKSVILTLTDYFQGLFLMRFVWGPFDRTFHFDLMESMP